jgi:hypothetical protein
VPAGRTPAEPTRLARAYADAGYFGRNIGAVEVLLDQDAVRSGAVAPAVGMAALAANAGQPAGRLTTTGPAF